MSSNPTLSWKIIWVKFANLWQLDALSKCVVQCFQEVTRLWIISSNNASTLSIAITARSECPSMTGKIITSASSNTKLRTVFWRSSYPRSLKRLQLWKPKLREIKLVIRTSFQSYRNTERRYKNCRALRSKCRDNHRNRRKKKKGKNLPNTNFLLLRFLNLCFHSPEKNRN